MGKLSNLKANKPLLIGLAIVIVFGVGSAAGYTLGLNRAQDNKTDSTSTSPGEPPETTTPPVSDELKKTFEGYKKQIAEGQITGTEKALLYINAALAGASADAPEAKEYAQEALNLMSTVMKNGQGGAELVSRLQKIAEGKYSEALAQE